LAHVGAGRPNFQGTARSPSGGPDQSGRGPFRNGPGVEGGPLRGAGRGCGAGAFSIAIKGGGGKPGQRGKDPINPVGDGGPTTRIFFWGRGACRCPVVNFGPPGVGAPVECQFFNVSRGPYDPRSVFGPRRTPSAARGKGSRDVGIRGGTIHERTRKASWRGKERLIFYRVLPGAEKRRQTGRGGAGATLPPAAGRGAPGPGQLGARFGMGFGVVRPFLRTGPRGGWPYIKHHSAIIKQPGGDSLHHRRGRRTGLPRGPSSATEDTFLRLYISGVLGRVVNSAGAEARATWKRPPKREDGSAFRTSRSLGVRTPGKEVSIGPARERGLFSADP